MGFTYNGIHSDDMGLTVRSSPSVLPPIETKAQAVSGRPGAYYQGSRFGAKTIQIEAGFIADSFSDYYNRLRIIAEWLKPEEPQALAFDDEPDKYYYAILSGDTSLERMARVGQGTLTFLCPDPYAYGPEQTQTINDPSAPDAVNSTILNEGTAESKPTFEITFNQPTTHFEIFNQDVLTPQGAPKGIVLGSPASHTQTQVDREELVMDDTMQSTADWQAAAEADHGYVAGTMAAGPQGFYAEKYDAAITPYAWQGPSLKRAIGASLQDFKADIYFSLMNLGHETGMIEVYLRDANNNVIAKIGFEDVWVDRDLTQGKMQVGDQNTGYDNYQRAVSAYGWNNFEGIMRIQRIGNVWHPYWAQIRPNGRQVWRRSTVYWTDRARQYMAPVTQIQVAMRKWPSDDIMPMYVHRIKTYRINQPQTKDQVPYIVGAGDVVEVDNATGAIYRNGEPLLTLTNVETDFFGLKPGYNRLEVTPSGVAKVDVSYQRRYL